MTNLVRLYKNNQPVYVEPGRVKFFLSLPGFSQEIVTPKKVEPLPVVEAKVTPVIESSPVEEIKEERDPPRRKRTSILEGLD